MEQIDDHDNGSADDIRVQPKTYEVSSDSSLDIARVGIGIGQGMDDDTLGVPSSFGGVRARKPRKRPRVVRDDGEDPMLSEERPADEVGGWEKHTRGIGSKLLKKMGFTGRLGARGTGLVEPIKFEVRPDASAGLGKLGNRSRRDAYPAEDDFNDLAKEATAPQWKRKRKRSVRKREPLPKARYFDMRSSNPIEAPNASQLHQRTHYLEPLGIAEIMQRAKDEEQVERDEKLHAEEVEKNILDNVKREEQRFVAEMKTYKDELIHFNTLIMQTKALKSAGTPEEFAISLENNCSAIYQEVRSSAQRFGIHEALLTVSIPHIRTVFRKNIRSTRVYKNEDASQGVLVRILKVLCGLLPGPKYIALCSKSILKEALSFHTFDVEVHSDAFARTFSNIRTMLHPIIISKFTEEVLLGALERRLQRSKSPPHTYVHVWLPVVGTQALEPIYPLVCRHLSKSLAKWNPAMSTQEVAKMTREYRLWKNVVHRKKLLATVERCILPKIKTFVSGMRVYNRGRYVGRVVHQWIDTCSGRGLVDAVMEGYWRDVEFVKNALFNDDDNDDMTMNGNSDVEKECAVIYRSWRNALDPLLKYVKHSLAALLFVLKAHVECRDVVVRKRLARFEFTGVRMLEKNLYKKKQGDAKNNTPVTAGIPENQQSIRDAVAELAIRNGLALLPDGRDRDGRAKFTIGNARIIIDTTRNLVLLVDAKNHGESRPVALSRLIQVASLS